MGATTEEQAAYETGFVEMLLAITSGDIPNQRSIGKEMETLFSLDKKSESVQTVQRGAILEIDKTISTERSCARIPSCKFYGKMAALLEYTKACRAHNLMPFEVNFC